MVDIHIREAQVEDAAGIAHVHVTMWQHAYRGQMPDDYLDGLSVDQRTQMWTRILSNPPAQAHTLVALDGEQVVGFCSVGKSSNADADEGNGELYAIYVDPRFKGKGVGAALMADALKKLREEGFTHATLWVLASNAPTIRFYEHQGWSADSATKTETLGGFELHELRYARKL